MAEIIATTPGLNYDPRNHATSRFFESLQAEIDKLQKDKRTDPKKSGRPAHGVPKAADFQNPQPLPDPGKPVTGAFPNPYNPVPVGHVMRT